MADVDREHAAGVADAEHLLAGQLPVDVAGQGGQVSDPLDVVLAVQDRLIQVRDAPAMRDVVPEQRRSVAQRPRRCWCCARSGTGVSSSPAASKAR